jgi:hypothetical protein
MELPTLLHFGADGLPPRNRHYSFIPESLACLLPYTFELSAFIGLQRRKKQANRCKEFLGGQNRRLFGQKHAIAWACAHRGMNSYLGYRQPVAPTERSKTLI